MLAIELLSELHFDSVALIFWGRLIFWDRIYVIWKANCFIQGIKFFVIFSKLCATEMTAV